MRLLVAAEMVTKSVDLSRLLEQGGFVIDAAGTLDDVIAALGLAAYDAMLLDLDLLARDTPGRRDCEVLRVIRLKESQGRILVLSDQSTSSVRIDALNKGADDVLGKPFAPEELLARLRALMRRPSQMVGLTLKIGNIEFNTVTGGVQIAGKTVRLRRREFAILEMLMRNKDYAVSRERIEQAVFSFNNPVTPNALEAAISRLRRNLSAHDATIAIVAQRSVGYQLVLRDEAVEIANGTDPAEPPIAAPGIETGMHRRRATDLKAPRTRAP